MDGFSFYFCIGKYGGFRYEVFGLCIRIVLGWISFAVGFWDIERDFSEMVAVIKTLTPPIRNDNP